jgi:hypothetical protein
MMTMGSQVLPSRNGPGQPFFQAQSQSQFHRKNVFERTKSVRPGQSALRAISNAQAFCVESDRAATDAAA